MLLSEFVAPHFVQLFTHELDAGRVHGVEEAKFSMFVPPLRREPAEVLDFRGVDG